MCLLWLGFEFLFWVGIDLMSCFVVCLPWVGRLLIGCGLLIVVFMWFMLSDGVDIRGWVWMFGS